MKFVYLDESGTGEEAISIMAGIVVDTMHMRKAKHEWGQHIQRLSLLTNKPFTELKASQLFNGKGPWKAIDGATRLGAVSEIIDWFEQSLLKVICVGVEQSKFESCTKQLKAYPEIASKWRLMAMHTVLALQKHFQSAPQRNTKRRKIEPKGHCLLIFDDQHRERAKFHETFLDPPAWSDEYYDLAKGQEKISQIIDVPHFVDSKHIGLVQLADLFAYILRRSSELSSGLSAPNFPTEQQVMTDLHARIAKHMLPKSANYPKRNRSGVAELLWEIAPEQVRNFNPNKNCPNE